MKLKKIYWYFFNRQRYYNYIIYQWLIRAKEYFLAKGCDSMCWALMSTMPIDFKCIFHYTDSSSSTKIASIIPYYTPDFFRTKEIEEDIDAGYWWPKEDRKSRIEAFDILIAIYKNMTK